MTPNFEQEQQSSFREKIQGGLELAQRYGQKAAETIRQLPAEMLSRIRLLRQKAEEGHGEEVLAEMQTVEGITGVKKDVLLEEEIPQKDRLLTEVESIVTETNDVKRRAEVDRFVERRLEELTESSQPTSLSLVDESVYKGFIHPETKIRRSLFVDAVRVDDPELYKVFLESLRQFKEDPTWKGKSISEITQYALTRTLGEYFGNDCSNKDTELRNRKFYAEHIDEESGDISISEFRGKNRGGCVEKAAVAQNLLTFMGYDSELVMSSNNRLNSPDVNDDNGHAYNIISSDKGHLIYDPTNPVIVRDTEDLLYTYLPSIYPISEVQHQNLVRGEQVEVSHNDLTWDGNAYQKQESKKRIYGGPK